MPRTDTPDIGQPDTSRERKAPAAPVLFLSNYFPPEVNALANRTSEHARLWVRDGGVVEVLAGPPHFPEGRVYDGFANRLSFDQLEGIDVMRVPMYVAANAGFLRRTLSYVSYMISSAWYAGKTRTDPGVVVASTPQFFAGLAGWLVSRRRRRPFVLEVRDLWPESIVQVGAMRRGVLIRLLEWLEGALYRAADHVVVVSPAFRSHVEARGVSPERITVLPNGVDAAWLEEPVSPSEASALRGELGLEGKFVVSYLGTVGMAHGLDVVLEAARRCTNPAIEFLVVGAGADWQRLRDVVRQERLDNLHILEKQSRSRIRKFYAASDASIIHLRDRPAFQKVIPSKMFESMAMERPIVLGVRGQAREILEAAGAGIPVEPENADDLLQAILRLASDETACRNMGESGAKYVRRHYDRRDIAKRYWGLLQEVAATG
jgi:glycosyltransferase involved in cell wall biosynthesis